MPHSAKASLNLYDIQGRLVRTLESGTVNSGVHIKTWDLKDNSGRFVANGIYLCRLNAGETTVTQKIAVVR
jgi:flagellar hook assembly protein FlgD